MNDPWEHDRLGYKAIGESFTNLIKSIDSAKVISIEAGFGRGKTFFREAWSAHLRNKEEIVVEIDVMQSDHSGDPVVTLLGALVQALPKGNDSKSKERFDLAKKYGAIGLRTSTKLVFRSAADELIDTVTEKAIDKLDDFDAFDGFINEVGVGMSKAAGQLIAAQMAAEKVREQELPQQIEALHSALLEGSNVSRVIIVVDELDRCHPDYAIAFLEAMKLVFNQTGFVFCLMVNADYLERLAQHRFGVVTNDEKYLDKFVDIRLRLKPLDDDFGNTVFDLASELPLNIPYGEGEEFSINRAANLAKSLAIETGFSIRKVKRIFLKIELVLRCYSEHPLDLSLLVFLAFQDETDIEIPESFLPRSQLTPEKRREILQQGESQRFTDTDWMSDLDREIGKTMPELLALPNERYPIRDDIRYHAWSKVYDFLAKHYIPSHRDALNAVAAISVPESEQN